MTIVFKAPARFEAAEVKALRAEFERLAAANDDVVVDLARTDRIDGSGIGALVFAFKRLAASGNRLTVRNISGQPLDLLNSADLLRTLANQRTEGLLPAGLRWMGMARPSKRVPGDAGLDRKSANSNVLDVEVQPKKGAA